MENNNFSQTNRVPDNNGNEDFSIASLAAELGISEEQAQQAIEMVGPDHKRVTEFVRRNNTDTDNTDDVDNGLKSPDNLTSEA